MIDALIFAVVEIEQRIGVREVAIARVDADDIFAGFFEGAAESAAEESGGSCD
jgi:uncharacterized small protein (DUF1192 family)